MRRLCRMALISVNLFWILGLSHAWAAEESTFLNRSSQWGSQWVAVSFIRQSPTFAFDGIADSLKRTDITQDAGDNGWTVIYEFQCSNSGYGDKTARTPDAVATRHTATIQVEQYKVVRADLDGQWDMINQKAMAPPFEPTPEQLNELVQGNTDFAFDLYKRIIQMEDGRSFFFSPYSISTAMAMAYAGARNETQAQMATVMHYNLPQETLHPVISALARELNSRGEAGLRLESAQAVWAQQGFDFEQAYKETITRYYGSAFREVDFKRDRDLVVSTINDWISTHTEGRIPEMLDPSDIDTWTILLLVNAIYFKAQWEVSFVDTEAVQPFYKLDGQTVDANMMHLLQDYKFTEGDGWLAVEVPYDGRQLSMVIVLPASGRFEEIQGSMDQAFVASVTQSLTDTTLNLSMPKFTLRTRLALRESLSEMGMPIAFNDQFADFSGIGPPPIWIQRVLHEAFVAVDENGTEAAAATVIVVDGGCGPGSPPRSVTLNRPFIFMIRDLPTNTILFMGRVLDPS